jgi:hypothetical protein
MTPLDIELAKLAEHKAIGWDFDKTLVNSEASEILHRFILDHPEIEHHIVTFRSHGLQHNVWVELEQYADAPGRGHFKGVVNIDDHRWEAWNDAVRRRTPGGGLSGPMSDAEVFYCSWKGQVCKDLGLTLLVDDDPSCVTLGCEAHGIAFYDPDSLIRAVRRGPAPT